MGSVGRMTTAEERTSEINVSVPAAMSDQDFREATNSIAREMNERQIDKKSFTNEGGGQWTLEIEGAGGIQILDETDSSRAGFGMGKAYGITVWDKNYNSQPQEIIYGSLNDAKRRAKEKLKGLL